MAVLYVHSTSWQNSRWYAASSSWYQFFSTIMDLISPKVMNQNKNSFLESLLFRYLVTTKKRLPAVPVFKFVPISTLWGSQLVLCSVLGSKTGLQILGSFFLLLYDTITPCNFGTRKLYFRWLTLGITLPLFTARASKSIIYWNVAAVNEYTCQLPWILLCFEKFQWLINNWKWTIHFGCKITPVVMAKLSEGLE